MLSNGLRVWVVETGLPLVSLRLVIPGGSAAMRRGGMALRTSQTTPSSTVQETGMPPPSPLKWSDSRSPWASTQPGPRVPWSGCACRQLDAGLGLMADMILRPRFDDADVERLKSLQIGSLTEYADDPRMLAAWALDARYYGDPPARPPH